MTSWYACIYNFTTVDDVCIGKGSSHESVDLHVHYIILCVLININFFDHNMYITIMSKHVYTRILRFMLMYT